MTQHYSKSSIFIIQTTALNDRPQTIDLPSPRVHLHPSQSLRMIRTSDVQTLPTRSTATPTHTINTTGLGKMPSYQAEASERCRRELPAPVRHHQ